MPAHHTPSLFTWHTFLIIPITMPHYSFPILFFFIYSHHSFYFFYIPYLSSFSFFKPSLAPILHYFTSHAIQPQFPPHFQRFDDAAEDPIISSLSLIFMKLINRAIYFVDGKAIGAGFSWTMYSPKVKAEVIALPTDHYDFLGPVSVIGKTRAEIEAEVKKIPFDKNPII